MGAISGILSLSNVGNNSAEEWVSEYQDTILVRNSRGLNAGTSLFGLMAKLKNEPTETTEYKWFERDPATRVVYAAAALDALAATTAWSIDDGAGNSVSGLIQKGTVIRTPKGELIRITAVTGTSVTINRHWSAGNGQSIPATVANDDPLTIVTLGKAEGDSPIVPVYEQPSTYTNFIQTFNSSVYLTNAFKASKLRTDIEGPLRERRVQALERIARDIELAYFFGRRTNALTDGNGKLYYTGGIVDSLERISATTPDQILNGLGATGVSLTVFNTWLSSFLTLGSEAKLAFCGPKSYAAISNFANSALNGFRITGQETVFGMNITEINTPFGSLSLAMHPLFKEISPYNDVVVVVDLGMIVQKVMEPLFLEPNIQTPGEDAYKEQFRAKYGLKLKFAQAFGYAYSFSKIV